MWGIISTTFIVLYCLMSYYLGRRGWHTLGRFIPYINRRIYWGFWGLLAFSFPAAEIGEDFLPPVAGAWLAIWGGYLMIAILYLFLFALLLDLIRIFDKGLSFIPAPIKEYKGTAPIAAITVVSLVAITLLYGTWNARNPVVVDYNITVEKQAGSLEKLKIALVSDIHYGEIIHAQRLKPMVEIMEKLQPDVIVIAGDIIEGNLKPEEGQKLARIFGQLPAKYGRFAVPGNHDRAIREDQQLNQYFEEAGVTVLRDEQLLVGDSFHIVGRDDPGHGRRDRKDLELLIQGIDSSLPVILIDHQPVDVENAQRAVDLQLSGHTHRGQIFPAFLITGQIYELDWGILKKEAYHLVVSSGYGTWGPPLRVGNNPEVVNITVEFTKPN